MKHAKDINGKIIEISRADKEEKYYCIACGEEVKAKKGSKKQYYSHLIDTNNYDCDEKVKGMLEFKEDVRVEENPKIVTIDGNEDLFNNKYNNDVEDIKGFTEEQLAVINSTEKRIIINARSGSGKTTVMEEYIRKHDDEKILYLVFNASAANSARERFDDANNVEIRTIHSFAYQYYGAEYKNFLTNNINIFDVAKGIDKFITEPKDFEYTENLLTHFETYLLSKYKTVNTYCDFYKLDSNFKRDLKKLFDKSKDKKMKITHSFYYKLWHLSNPEFKGYTTLLIDEVNDINEALVDIIENNTYLDKIILCGDEYQSLFKFAKCVNAFELLDNSKWKQYKLTNSFRFGNTLAKIIEQSFSSQFNDFSLVGLNKLQLVKSKIDLDKPYYMLCRYNATIIKNVIKEALKGKKIYIEGGKAGISFSFLKYLYEFKYHNKQHFTLKRFEDFEHLVNYAEKTNDYEFKFALNLLDEYKESLLLHIRNAEENLVEDWRMADVSFSTGHKVKGASITIPVLIANDFPSILEIKENEKYTEEEIMSESCLLYVVCSRSKFDFELPPQLIELYENNKNKEDLCIK